MEAYVNKYIAHIRNLFSVGCDVYDIGIKRFSSVSYCDSCPCQCDYKNTHLYGCYESQRWGGKYVYYCPAGHVFIALSLLDDIGILEGGVIVGPIAMGREEDLGGNLGLPIFDAPRMHDLTELLAAVFKNDGATADELSERQKQELLNSIYLTAGEVRENKAAEYPIMLEKDLLGAIGSGDIDRSKELLNKLLGHIFFSSGGDMTLIRSRALELVVMLSRAAIEGGAHLEQIFETNYDYIARVQSARDIEGLSVWLIEVINRFVGYMFEFGAVKHADVIYKATAYIKANYNKKLTLEDIAAHVYLSTSYLSKIFKEEMDISITAYINRVRIEKSRLLLDDGAVSLIEIANAVGFEDQSYFTKVFKKETGVSPGKYRLNKNSVKERRT